LERLVEIAEQQGTAALQRRVCVDSRASFTGSRRNRPEAATATSPSAEGMGNGGHTCSLKAIAAALDRTRGAFIRSDLTRDSLSLAAELTAASRTKRSVGRTGGAFPRMVLPGTATSALSVGDSAPGNRVDIDGKTRSGHGYGD
jgi:hypothetical protein